MLTVDDLYRGAYALGVTEALERLVARGVGRHAGGDVFLNARLDVKRELVVHICPEIGAPDGDSGARRDRSSSAAGNQIAAVVAVSTFETAWEKIDHVDVSARSCFRPSVVMR